MINGYSKSKCFIDLSLALSFIGLIAGGINMIFVRSIPYLFDLGLFHLISVDGGIYIGEQVFAVMIGFVVLCVAFSLLFSGYFIRKGTAIEIYRRNT